MTYIQPDEYLKFIIILILIVLVSGLWFLVWKWPQGKSKSFSQHAAAYRHTYFYYIGLFAVVLPLLLLFFTGYFIPTFNLSVWFIVFISLSIVAQALAVLIPESGDKKGRYHRCFAYISAFLLVPSLAIVTASELVSTFARSASIAAVFIMLAIIGRLVFIKGKHNRLLWLQIGYFVAFFAAIMSATYL